MKIVMDIIWIDIATQSWKYTDKDGNTQYAFVSASGRMYMDNKCSDDMGNRLRPYINLVLENGDDYKSVSNRFFVCFKRMYEAEVNGEPIYRVPEVIKAIFDDPAKEQIVKSSNGITLDELVSDGFVGEEVHQIMMQTGMEAFSNSQVIDNSIRYLNENLTRDMNLDTIARRFFVSKYYLCRAFKKHNGVSVHGYINHKRIMYAKQLIEQGDTASGAAYKVGFGDYSAFYRAYVKIIGKSPTA
jgi:AraC-like DNA-binding protein